MRFSKIIFFDKNFEEIISGFEKHENLNGWKTNYLEIHKKNLNNKKIDFEIPKKFIKKWKKFKNACPTSQHTETPRSSKGKVFAQIHHGISRLNTRFLCYLWTF